MHNEVKNYTLNATSQQKEVEKYKLVEVYIKSSQKVLVGIYRIINKVKNYTYAECNIASQKHALRDPLQPVSCFVPVAKLILDIFVPWNTRTQKFITGQRMASKSNMRTQRFIAGKKLAPKKVTWEHKIIYLDKGWHQKVTWKHKILLVDKGWHQKVTW